MGLKSFPLFFLHYFCVSLLITLLAACNMNKEYIKPPEAKKVPRTFEEHGNKRTDDYFWLNQRESKEVREYIEAENAYTKKMLSDTEGLQQKLYDEIVGRIKQQDMSVPYKLNGYYHYVKYDEGNEYPVYCRKKESLSNEEEIVLDVNKMAKGYEYYNVSGYTVSPDNKMIAFGVDTVSRRLYTIYFKNLETGEILEQSIPSTNGAAYWGNDNQTVFYVKKDDETLRSYQVYRFNIRKANSSELVYEEKDETFSTILYKTRTKKYIVIGSLANMTCEYRLLEADNPKGEFKIFQPRVRGLEYSIGHQDDKFYVLTNMDARNFKLMETPEHNTGKDHWKELVPHRENVLLEDFINFKDYLVLDERIKGNTNFRIINLNTKEEKYMNFDEEVYMAYIYSNPEFNSDALRFRYSSLTIPNSVYDYDMSSHTKTLLKRQEVVGGYNPENYESQRLYATARDGVKVPISIVYKKGVKFDGSAPLLLYAYGSYGITFDPNFSSARLSLLDRGFIYAIAHIRGGQFLGREWYEDGKLLKKKNTFTDYIACAEFLLENNYTSKEKLMAQGGSAGGLLMGAVINSRPDLFEGVIAAVPFVDVINTMLDETLPLTTGEYDEWGNPNEDTYYHYILSYSPYDNVKAQNYPNMLVTAGFHDSQVQYWEPAKWVAKLRDLKTDDNLLLLYTNMGAGHSGITGRFKQHKEKAMEYAFLLNLLGIEE